jgi:hypothetical protein
MYRIEKAKQMVYDCRTGKTSRGYHVIAPDGKPVTLSPWTYDVAVAIKNSANLASAQAGKEITSHAIHTTD